MLVYLHGGGFIAGDADTYDGVMRRLASLAHVAVVSVNYRLAPEHKYPAALTDAYMALQWTTAHASTYGWSADRIAWVAIARVRISPLRSVSAANNRAAPP